MATNGQVIDPETRAEIARYPDVIGGIWPNAFAYDGATERMYVVSDDYAADTAAKVSVYDARTYTLLESQLVEGVGASRNVWSASMPIILPYGLVTTRCICFDAAAHRTRSNYSFRRYRRRQQPRNIEGTVGGSGSAYCSPRRIT